jgi:cytochrome c
MKTNIVALLAILCAACGAGAAAAPPAAAPGDTSGGAPAAAPAAAGPAAGAPAGGVAAPSAPGGTTVDQVRVGQKAFAENCSSCHGANGEGKGRSPALIGKGALPLEPRAGAKRNAQFKTAADVFKYAKASMPPDKPGSLSDDQYWSIIAFDLKSNGVDVAGKTLDASSGASVSVR